MIGAIRASVPKVVRIRAMPGMEWRSQKRKERKTMRRIFVFTVRARERFTTMANTTRLAATWKVGDGVPALTVMVRDI